MHQLILCTCPDAEVAERIAGELVGLRLAACVNILPGITSIYAWQGRIESAQEHLLLIKSHSSRYAAIEAAIHASHPYEVPEIVAVPLERGSAAYLQWIDSCVASH